MGQEALISGSVWRKFNPLSAWRATLIENLMHYITEQTIGGELAQVSQRKSCSSGRSIKFGCVKHQWGELNTQENENDKL